MRSVWMLPLKLSGEPLRRLARDRQGRRSSRELRESSFPKAAEVLR